jgi:putative transposase
MRRLSSNHLVWELEVIRFSFRKGLVFWLQLKRLTLQRQLLNGRFQFETDEGEIHTLTRAEVLENWRSHRWVLDEKYLTQVTSPIFLATPRELSVLPEIQRQSCTRKTKYVDAYLKARAAGNRPKPDRLLVDEVIAAVASHQSDDRPPSRDTLFRWTRKYRHTKCPLTLIDGRCRSGRKRSEAAFQEFEEVLKEKYLTAQKLPMKRVVEALHERINQRNITSQDASSKLVTPSVATIYRWARDLNYALSFEKRNGKRAANHKLRPAIGMVSVKEVLERVEIDHTPINLQLIDLDTGLWCGKAWLTAVLDRYSRVVLGFYTSFSEPSANSVLMALKHAILPKGEALKNFDGIENDWPCYGLPDQIVTDNGMELHAMSFTAVCQDLGIEIQYCPTATPQYKGAVERFFRTIAEDLFHQLPGTTFSNIRERGNYPAEKNAFLDIQTLRYLVTRWIVDEYHQTPHRGLNGRTPIQLWNEGVSRRTLELPAYPEQLDNIIGESTTRSVFHYGIELEKMKYNSRELQEIKLRREHTQKLCVKFHMDHIKSINVLDPDTDEYITVPAVDQEYAEGLTRELHRLLVEDNRRSAKNGQSPESLRATKQRRHSFVKHLEKSKKSTDRRRAARNRDALRHRGEQDACKPIDPTSRYAEPLPPGLDDDLPTFEVKR